MNSDISFGNNSLLIGDLPLELLTLEVQVTQEILGLKQDKLTNLAEYNAALGERFKVERELTSLKKKNAEKERESIQTGGETAGEMWLNDVNSSPQQTLHSGN